MISITGVRQPCDTDNRAIKRLIRPACHCGWSSFYWCSQGRHILASLLYHFLIGFFIVFF